MEAIDIVLVLWAVSASFLAVLGYKSKKAKRDYFLRNFGRSDEQRKA